MAKQLHIMGAAVLGAAVLLFVLSSTTLQKTRMVPAETQRQQGGYTNQPTFDNLREELTPNEAANGNGGIPAANPVVAQQPVVQEPPIERPEVNPVVVEQESIDSPSKFAEDNVEPDPADNAGEVAVVPVSAKPANPQNIANGVAGPTTKKNALVTGAHHSATTYVGTTIVALAPEFQYFYEPLHKNAHWGWYPYFNDTTMPAARVKVAKDIFATKLKITKPGCTRKMFKDPLSLLSVEFFAQNYDALPIFTVRNPAEWARSLRTRGEGFNMMNFKGQPELMDNLLAPYKEEILAFDEPDNAKPLTVKRAALVWRILYGTVRTYLQDHPEWRFVIIDELMADRRGMFQHIADYYGFDLDPNMLEENKKEDDKRKDYTRNLTEEEADQLRVLCQDVSEFFYPDGW